MVINWTAKAKTHLSRIYNYYQTVANSRTAKKMVRSIVASVKLLRQNPRMAAIEPLLSDFPQLFRSLVVEDHYKVVYYVEDETIHIVTVFDSRQDPHKLIKEIFG